MTPPIGMICIGMPGGTEIVVLLVIGLLLFGRRLPEIARNAGQTVVKFRRGFEEFKRQIDEDESLREAKESVQQFKSAIDVPRIATDPKRMIKRFTDDAMKSPLPEDAPRKNGASSAAQAPVQGSDQAEPAPKSQADATQSPDSKAVSDVKPTSTPTPGPQHTVGRDDPPTDPAR